MSTTTLPQISAGTWEADKVHSSIEFSVKHMVVATFRGSFADYDATLVTAEGADPRLEGVVRAASVQVKDENLQAHLGSPDFFDIERTPEITFSSTAFRVDGESVEVEGDLTIKGTTQAVTAHGTFTYIEADMGGGRRIGLELETKIDRTAFGLNWNAPLPKGGFAVANDVKLHVNLELTPAA